MSSLSKTISSYLIALVFIGCRSSNDKVSVESDRILSPEEAIADFKVEDGFEIQTVLAEPLIEDPVALTFDADGNMWIVELRGYMHDEEGTGEDLPLGRIKIVNDNDANGEYETSTIFLDSLIMPRAIAIVNGGALLIEPPSLYFIENRNGKAGKKILLDSSFAETGNVEHQPNGLMHGIDNWIYCAKANKRVRFMNNEWKIESTLARGQWGISQDDHGRIFYNDNSTLLMADNFLPQEFDNIDRPFISGKAVFVRLASNRVYPRRETKGINRGYQKGMLDSANKLVNVTSACGPVVYRGDNFPPEYRGNVFIMEPAAYLVKRVIVSEDQEGLLTGKFPYENNEFITATDERFRPVNAYTAPDGSIYIIDMHRGIIQHTTYLTPYLRKHIDSLDLQRPISMGRVYRVKWKKNPLSKQVKLSGLSSKELIVYLSHPNGWYRDMAQRIIVERKDTSVAGELIELINTGKETSSRLHGLFTLEGIGMIDLSFIREIISRPTDRKIYSACLYILKNHSDHKQAYQILDASIIPANRISLINYLNALSTFSKRKLTSTSSFIFEGLGTHPNDSLFVDASIHAIKGEENNFFRQTLLRSAIAKDSLFNKVLKGVLLQESLVKNNNINHLNSREKELFNTGKDNFSRFCVSCHGANGEGVVNIAPPLSLSEWVNTRDFTVPANIILDGMTGPVEVNGKKYEAPAYQGSMQGLRNNIETNNGVIASVLTYIRNSWGNRSSAVTVEQVAELRASTKERSQPYTEVELKPFLKGSSRELLDQKTYQAKQDSNWINLFNGRTKKGWHQVGGKAIYKVEKGMITGITVKGTPNSFLVTNKIYSDFILELDVWIDTSLNSGIQIRSNSDPAYKNGVFHGYQVEIDPSNRAWSGGIYDESRRGWLVDLKNKPVAQKAFNKNGWNKYRIEAKGPIIKTWINGIPVATLKDSMTANGRIGLQVHSVNKEQLAGKKVKWKNVRIKTF